MITIVSAKSCSEPEIEKAHSILIEAYALTEIEIWGSNYSRISIDEYKALISQNLVLFAKNNNAVVGCIQFQKLSKEVYTFGLLAADFSQKGLGIGRALIHEVEQIAIDDDATFMQIEILKPRDIEVKSKIDLHNWYLRLNYVYTGTKSFLDLKPDKKEKNKLFINPSVFDCYQKRLQ